MRPKAGARPRGSIEVQGAKTVIRELVRMGDEMKLQVKKVHLESAQVVSRRAEHLVPRRTGRLAGTIRATGTQRGGYVRAGRKSVPYAGPIHFGWPNRPNNAKEWRGGPIRPNPFLYAALESRRMDVESRFWQALMKAQKRAGLK